MQQFDCNIQVASLLDYKRKTFTLKPGKYTFYYDYPLGSIVAVKHKLTRYVGLLDVLIIASKDYKQIYDNDEKYGVWGHGLEDLYFEGVKVNQKTKEIFFVMGS